MPRTVPSPLIMQMGYLFLGCMPVLVCIARDAGWDSATTVMARFAIACLCIIVAVLTTGQSLRTSNLGLLVFRGLIGGVAVLCFFFSLQMCGASVGTLLNFTHSIWANVLGVLLLGQRPFLGFWFFLIMAMTGLWLVIDPTFTTFKWGEALGLLSGILGGCAILCIKELRKTDNALTILASFSVVGLLCSLPFADFSRIGAAARWVGSGLAVKSAAGTAMASAAALSGWEVLVGVGLLAFFGQLLFTQGYKNTSVQLGTLLSLTVPVMATLMGWFILNEPLTAKFVLGACLILTTCTVVRLKEMNSP